MQSWNPCSKRRTSASTTSITRRFIIHLIGINGFKRSGKNTVADCIWASYGTADEPSTVIFVAFADKLKIMAALALGLEGTEEELIAFMDEAKEEWRIKVCGDFGTMYEITGREYLQNFGNHARKVFGDTFWIDQILPNPALFEGWGNPSDSLLDAAYPSADCVVVTDVRYPNEAERVKSLGGVVWEVVRPGLESDGHASEQPLPTGLVDLTIDNDGTLKDLGLKVEQALDSLHV